MDKLINAFNRLFKNNKIVTLSIIALLGLIVVVLGKDLISAYNANKQGSLIIQGDGTTTGDIKIDNRTYQGISLEYHEKSLKRQLIEMNDKLKVEYGAEKTLLFKQIEKHKNDLNDLQSSYEKAKKEQEVLLKSLAEKGLSEANLKLANDALLRGERDVADTLFKDYIENETMQKQITQNADAHFQRAEIANKDLRLKDAQYNYERAVALVPKNTLYLNNLALLYIKLAMHKVAEPLIRRALAIDESNYGEDHPIIAIRLDILAQILQVTNRMGEAETLIRRALAINEANYDKHHPMVAINLSNLAMLLKDMDHFQEAEPLIRRALAIDEASFGENHPRVATGLNNLATLLMATHRIGEAEPLLRRALVIDQTYFGEDHPDFAIDLNNLAHLLQATDRMGEAEPLMRRALKIDEAVLGVNHPTVAKRLYNLARLLQATSRMNDAEPLMRRTIGILTYFTKKTGHQHPDLDTAFEDYRSLLFYMNKSEAEIKTEIEGLSK